MKLQQQLTLDGVTYALSVEADAASLLNLTKDFPVYRENGCTFDTDQDCLEDALQGFQAMQSELLKLAQSLHLNLQVSLTNAAAEKLNDKYTTAKNTEASP